MEQVKEKSGDLTPGEIGEATKPFLKIDEEREKLKRAAQKYSCHSEDLNPEEVMSEVEQAMLALLNQLHEESCYLYTYEKSSTNLHIFSIREKKFSKCEIEIKTGWTPSTLTVGRFFYCAYGQDKPYYSLFFRVSPEGKQHDLGELPTPKWEAPMVYWSERRTIITVGGYQSEKAAT